MCIHTQTTPWHQHSDVLVTPSEHTAITLSLEIWSKHRTAQLSRQHYKENHQNKMQNYVRKNKSISLIRFHSWTPSFHTFCIIRCDGILSKHIFVFSKNSTMQKYTFYNYIVEPLHEVCKYLGPPGKPVGSDFPICIYTKNREDFSKKTTYNRAKTKSWPNKQAMVIRRERWSWLHPAVHFLDVSVHFSFIS